jgi:anionic cell wall polymer biosynthesis LytR-Cps2A-Psr (LCP) family protein
VDIHVPAQPGQDAPGATAQAAGTRIAATATGPTFAVEATPTPASVDALTTAPPTPTDTPAPATGQTVRLTPLPTDAATQLTPTETLTDTAVPPPADLVVLPPGTLNIALLGVDTRPQKGFANTDVILIASINPDVPAVTLLSIPRDLLVYIPGWRSHKVNTAFAHGGPELFKQTIRYNFGINIDYYAMVNFAAVVNAVETLDGVDVIATCPLYHVFPKDPYYMADDTSPMTVTQVYTDTFSGEVWPVGSAVPTQTIDIPGPGVYSLDGLQALAYVRARYGVPGGDVDRGRREQRLVRALYIKAKQVNAIPRIPQLYAQFHADVQTDFSLSNLLYFAGLAGRVGDAVVRSRYLNSADLRGAMLPEVGSVLIPDREKMQSYIQQALRVALNQRPNEGIPLEVWNGTPARDFGIVAADRMAELGFRVTNVQQADRLYTRTTLIDHTTTAKGSAVPLLQRTFGLKNEQVVAQPNKDGPRYRLIVGSDFNPCYYMNRSDATP